MTNSQLEELIDPDGPFGGIDIATAVRFQLGSRHYPPIRPEVDASAIAAIEACSEGDPSRLITLWNGREIPAEEIVDDLHLWPLVDFDGLDGSVGTPD